MVMFKKIKLGFMLTALAAIMLSMVGSARAADKVTIRYGLWDTNQLPPYQACADAFMKANPNIEVKVEQLGWADYWTGISTGFASGDTYDVFTNHLAKYPEFAQLKQIMDIQPLVDRDKVPTDIYYPGLADLWTREGKRYGLPKDWDTVGVVYNVDALKAAGVTADELNKATWNPKDGGTFEQIIAKLTIDKNGKNGLDKAFDKANVVQYGFATGGMGGAYGQTEWSMFAVANGFKFNNGTWGNKYFYDDPKLAETMQWLADLWLKKGYAPPLADQTSLGRSSLFQSKKVALVIDGSWMIGTYIASEFKVAFARLPQGPVGRRSMFNGLADSIYVGTKHVEESWKWVKYLASPECENVVGDAGVVFPAIRAAADKSVKARKDKGIDVSPFTDQANEKDGTFLFPITDNGANISTIMNEAMDNIGLGKSDAATALKKANDEVNKLFAK